MVATVNGMFALTHYLSAQKTWRWRDSGGGVGPPVDLPGLLTPDAGAPGAWLWWNPQGILGLEDGAVVGTREFRHIYAGFDPATGERLTRNAAGGKRSPGLDMTLAPDKTVSALWAIADEKTRAAIEDVHNEAVRTSLDMVVTGYCAWTRTRPRGGDIVFEKAKLCGAMLRRGMSGAGDPHLHTHCLIFNVTQAEDGIFRSHYRRPVFHWKKAAGAVYRNALARGLQDHLAVTMERYGRDDAFTRIVGIPDELVAEWSKRRGIITDMAAGEDGPAVAGGGEGRGGEDVGWSVAQLDRLGAVLRHVAWDLEAVAHIEDRVAFVEGIVGQDMSVGTGDIEAACARVEKIPDELTRVAAMFRLQDVIERAMNATAGVFSPHATMAVVDQVMSDSEVVELNMTPSSLKVDAGMAHIRVFSTAAAVRRKRDAGGLVSAVASEVRSGPLGNEPW